MTNDSFLVLHHLSPRHIDDIPRRADAQEFRHQTGVQDVAAAFGDDLAHDGHSQQRKVADDVEDLVTHKFVAKTQTCLIQHSVTRQHDRVIE